MALTNPSHPEPNLQHCPRRFPCAPNQASPELLSHWALFSPGASGRVSAGGSGSVPRKGLCWDSPHLTSVITGVWPLALHPHLSLMCDCGASQGSQDPPAWRLGLDVWILLMDLLSPPAWPWKAHRNTMPKTPHPQRKTSPSSSPNHHNTNPVLWPKLLQTTPSPRVFNNQTLHRVPASSKAPASKPQQNTSTLPRNGSTWC